MATHESIKELFENTWNPMAQQIPFMRQVENPNLIRWLLQELQRFHPDIIRRAMEEEFQVARPDIRHVITRCQDLQPLANAAQRLHSTWERIQNENLWGCLMSDSPFIGNVQALSSSGLYVWVENARYPQGKRRQHCIPETDIHNWEFFPLYESHQKLEALRRQYEGTPDPIVGIRKILAEKFNLRPDTIDDFRQRLKESERKKQEAKP